MKKTIMMLVIVVLLIILVVLWLTTPFGIIIKGLVRPDGASAMKHYLESKYNESFTLIEDSVVYSTNGEIIINPTKGCWSAEFKCQSQPYYHISCAAQLKNNRISYEVWDDYDDQLARYEYRATMTENIKGIFPEGSYVWVDYSRADVDRAGEHKGFYVSVFVEDMSVGDAQKAVDQLKELIADQGLYPKVAVRKDLGDKESFQNIMTEDPKHFTAVDQDWTETIVDYE